MAQLPHEAQEELSFVNRTMTHSIPMRRKRWYYLTWLFLAMVAGLLWRSRLVPLTPFLSKYGGDAIWAAMVFFGFGFLFPRGTTFRLAMISLGFAWGIEFLQLYQAPWIESIRSYRLGHLVLGSTFNWPDLPSYAVGVALGVILEIRSACFSQRVR
jgi:hypothetical protein